MGEEGGEMKIEDVRVGMRVVVVGHSTRCGDIKMAGMVGTVNHIGYDQIVLLGFPSFIKGYCGGRARDIEPASEEVDAEGEKSCGPHPHQVLEHFDNRLTKLESTVEELKAARTNDCISIVNPDQHIQVHKDIEKRLAVVEKRLKGSAEMTIGIDDATFKRNCEEWEREHIGVREEVGVKLPRAGQLIYVRDAEDQPWKFAKFDRFINGDSFYTLSANHLPWKYWSPIPREDIE